MNSTNEEGGPGTDGHKKLSEDERRAIHSYLAKLAMFLGVPNALFILGAFVYLLFLLPGQAAEQANSKLDQEIALIRGELLNSSVEAIRESGRAQAVIERVTGLEPKVAALEGNVAALAASDAAQAGQIINTLKENPLAEQALSVAARVQKLESRQPSHSSCSWVQVGAGGDSRAQCPSNQYIAGLRQQYHGGSWRNWISEILCCSLFEANS